MSDPMDPIALLRGVRNVRAFRPDPVPESALADLLEVARWTGSARNTQPWEFVVVRSAATLRALAAVGPNLAWIAGAPLAFVPVLSGEAAETETFDEGRLSERVMVAARARGLEAGLGWFLPGPARAAAREVLGVPEDRLVRTMIAVGVPAEVAPPGGGPARKPLAELVHVDRFGQRSG